MSPGNPFQASLEPPPGRLAGGSHEDIVDECHMATAGALLDARAAPQADITHALAAAREAHAGNKPQDVLECLARILGTDEEQMGKVVGSLSERVAQSMMIPPPLVPFASKLIAPSSFYDSFEQIHKLASRLLTPVLYAEDTDAIGVASVNPIAADIFSQEIANAVFRRFGIRPFVSTVRIDYETWCFLHRKHFGL